MNTTPAITPELRALLRQVELGRCLDTLPERLALATTSGLGHAEFLELVLADEVTRRETSSASLRARTAGLDPAMTGTSACSFTTRPRGGGRSSGRLPADLTPVRVGSWLLFPPDAGRSSPGST